MGDTQEIAMMKLSVHLFVCTATFWAAAPAAMAQQDVQPRPAEIDPATIDDGVARQRIGAQRNAALERCEMQAGNPRAVCRKEAEGREKIALAELAHQRNPSEANARRLADTKAGVDHEIAREKCNAHEGDERNACLSRAASEAERARRQGVRPRLQ
jgi:hypothetical protein